MRTMGIAPGDAVLMIEHRGEQQIVYNALIAGISMDEKMAGTHGEPAIEVAFVADRGRFYNLDMPDWHPTVNVPSVVHISHRDWIERRASLGYEELPEAAPGVCRYCRCTQRRACAGGCAWIDQGHTVCSAASCEARWIEDNKLRAGGRTV